MHFSDNGDTSAGDTIVIDQVTFDSISCVPQTAGSETYGGVFYFDCYSIDSVTLTEVVATNFESETHGGFFYFENFSGDLLIDGTVGTQQPTFTDFIASTAGSFLFSQAVGLNIDIYNALFECDTSVTAVTLDATV